MFLSVRADANFKDNVLTREVVQDGQVWTAKEGILHGSMSQLVIKACAALQIPIIQESPSYNDRNLWQAAFLTSMCDHQ